METGTTIIMVGGVIMMDGVIDTLGDGGRVQILMSTWDQLTPPTDTMRILLHMGITDTPHTGTTADTRTEDDGGPTHAAHNRRQHLYRQGRL